MTTRITVFQAIVLLLLSSCGLTGVSPGPSGSTCVDFQSTTPFPQTFAGPTFPSHPLIFHNPQQNGVPQALTLEDRVEDQDGRPELNVGYSRSTTGSRPLIVDFPSSVFPTGVGRVLVELRHFASAAVTAKNTSGGVVATATQPAHNTRAFLTLRGPGITQLEFDAAETLLYRICWM